jgi:hypothetical protein
LIRAYEGLYAPQRSDLFADLIVSSDAHCSNGESRTNRNLNTNNGGGHERKGFAKDL